MPEALVGGLRCRRKGGCSHCSGSSAQRLHPRSDQQRLPSAADPQLHQLQRLAAGFSKSSGHAWETFARSEHAATFLATAYQQMQLTLRIAVLHCEMLTLLSKPSICQRGRHLPVAGVVCGQVLPESPLHRLPVHDDYPALQR